LKDDLKRLLGL